MVDWRILIVDDEPHVVEAIAAILDGMEDIDCEIYRAYSAAGAVDILEKGRVDLIVSDIEMPVKSGLDLLDTVRRIWPMCRVLFLTAYSRFDYAYQAIRGEAAGYLLKTEDDSAIAAEIRRILDGIVREYRRIPAMPIPENAAAQMLVAALCAEHGDPARLPGLLAAAGFAAPECPYCLVSARVPASQTVERPFISTLEALLRKNLAGRISGLCVARYGKDEAVCILAPTQLRDASDRSHLLGALETVQTACGAIYGSDVPMVACFLAAGEAPLTDALRSVRRALSSLPDGYGALLSVPPLADGGGTVASTVVCWIRQYISAHALEDVTLMKLSSLTGYGSAYLSDLFRRQTGETVSRYSARMRMAHITRLFTDTDNTIEDVCAMAGFASRSYFNRFIKKETGLSPRQLRAQILLQADRPADDS